MMRARFVLVFALGSLAVYGATACNEEKDLNPQPLPPYTDPTPETSKGSEPSSPVVGAGADASRDAGDAGDAGDASSAVDAADASHDGG
jgi:hypothetical protein